MSLTRPPDDLSGYPVIVALPVLWGDQDAFGHVNNAVPIRWFESARIAYIEQSGMAHLRNSSGIGPILAAIDCNYRRQLHYPDTVRVAARVARIGRSSMIMEHAVLSERLGEIAAWGASTVVMFDYATGKPQRITESLRAEIERIEGRSLGTAPAVE